MGQKGQKVNPIGWRVGVHRKWKTTWFQENKNYTKFIFTNFKINDFIKGVLYYNPKKSLLVHTNILQYSSEKLFIFIFFYRYRYVLDNRLKRYKKWKQRSQKKIGKSNLINYKMFNYKKRDINNLSFFYKFYEYNNWLNVLNYKINNNDNILFYQKNKYLFLNIVNKLSQKYFITKYLNILNNNYNKQLIILENKSFKLNNINVFLKKFIMFILYLNLYKTDSIKHNKYYIYIYLLYFIKNQFLNNLNNIDMNYYILFNNKFKLNRFLKKNFIFNLNLNYNIAFNEINLFNNNINIIKKPIISVVNNNNLKYNILNNLIKSNNNFVLNYYNLFNKNFINNEILKKKNFIYYYFTRILKSSYNDNKSLVSTFYSVLIFLKNLNYSSKENLFIKNLIKSINIINFNHKSFFFNNKSIFKLSKIDLNVKKKNWWWQHDIVYRHKYLTNNLRNLKQSLRILSKSKISIYLINSLSLSRFHFRLWDNNIKSYAWKSFKLKNKKKYFALEKNTSKVIKKFKNRGVFLKDLYYLSFITMFLKRPIVLAKFIGFQVKKLPQNKRQIPFLRFIMKTVLNFSGGRSEIIGIKLQFKGRFDRWRRTKSLIAKGGSIPAQTFNALIEYGSSKGFVKKGAFGIRIWIRYEKIFGLLYKQTFEQYFMYSCLNKINKI